jgi:hypothetical protein
VVSAVAAFEGGGLVMILRVRPRMSLTFPTAASPSSTSLTLLLGLGAVLAADSLMLDGEEARFARRLLPTLYSLVLKVFRGSKRRIEWLRSYDDDGRWHGGSVFEGERASCCWGGLDWYGCGG